MNVHHNARMTVHGRLLLVRRVRGGLASGCRGGGCGGLGVHCLQLAGAVLGGGERALHDRSSAPARSPHRLPAEATPRSSVCAANAGPGRASRTLFTGRSRPSALCCAGSGSAAWRPWNQATGDPLPTPCSGRAAPHRHQEARPDRRPWPPRHRRPSPPGPRARLGAPARRDRRRLAPRLHRAVARRTRPELRRLPRPRRRLVRQPRRPDRAGHDRQRLRLHQGARVPGHPRRARRAPPDYPALSAAHQRQAERFIQTALREWLYHRPTPAPPRAPPPCPPGCIGTITTGLTPASTP